jgi:carbon monoxide dehydrogenase subunit G
MAFEITKTFTIKAPAAQVWEFLTDPERVAKSLPGAAITGKLDDKTWSGTMTVKVGPVSSSYKGKVIFERLDPGTRTAEIAATGMDVRGKGGADLKLTSSVIERGPSETEVTTVSRVNITGILAQMGRGMIQDVSDQMFQLFSQRMRAELEAASPAAAAQTAASAAETAALSGQAAPMPRAAAPTQAAALDLGSIGARAALRRPEVWAALLAVIVVLYLLFR